MPIQYPTTSFGQMYNGPSLSPNSMGARPPLTHFGQRRQGMPTPMGPPNTGPITRPHSIDGPNMMGQGFPPNGMPEGNPNVQITPPQMTQGGNNPFGGAYNPFGNNGGAGNVLAPQPNPGGIVKPPSFMGGPMDNPQQPLQTPPQQMGSLRPYYG